jgi:hypothetical protein
MPESHLITNPALRYLGPRTEHHPQGLEFILGSKPLQDALIDLNRMLSLEQLNEALIALHQHSDAEFSKDADPRKYIKYMIPGSYMVTDERGHIFHIRWDETSGWQVQFKDERWYTPEHIAALAA